MMIVSRKRASCAPPVKVKEQIDAEVRIQNNHTNHSGIALQVNHIPLCRGTESTNLINDILAYDLAHLGCKIK